MEAKTNKLFDVPEQEKLTLFRNCKYAKYEDFVLMFKDPAFAQIDLNYYYNAVKDWGDISNKKRTARGWIATARNFMRSDIEKKKLHTISEIKNNTNALDYLKGYE